MVVGGGQGDDLADGLAGQGVGAGAGEGRRVVHASDPHDEALTGHEARYRVQGADHAWVGQGHGGTPEVVEVQLVLTSLGHERLVGLHEPGQVHEVGLLDGGHQQTALTVGAGHVDGQAEGHVCGLVQDRLAGLVDAVGDVHRGHLGEGLDHRPADEVGEGDLAAAGAGQVAVDDGAVLDEDLGGDGPGGGGRGHGQGVVHVLGGAGGCTLEAHGAVLAAVALQVVGGVGGQTLGVGGGRGSGARRRGRGKVGAGDVLDRGGAAPGGGGLSRDGGPARLPGGRRRRSVGEDVRGGRDRPPQTGARVGLEELTPLVAHRGGISRPGGPHLLHHPLVGAEAGAGLVLRGHVGSPR